MFRLHKVKSDKSPPPRLRIDFSLSAIQASQVPKGWDKLFVSVISVETGKVIIKSGKATVKNGKCRWTETLSESLCITDGETKQDTDQCLIKLVISAGPARSGFLGEVTMNLVDHISSTASGPLSVPLQKCSHGTTLHVKVQCISPRTNHSNASTNDDGSNAGDLNTDCDDMENKSDVSETCFTRSIGSSSSNCFDSSSQLEDVGSRDTTLSTSGSRNSFESLDGSLGRGNFSPCSNLSGHTDDTLGRKDSIGSQSALPYALYPGSDPPKSHRSSFNSKVPSSGGQPLCHVDGFGCQLVNTGSSKDLLEPVDGSQEEFRIQAKKWEQNARRLTAELERLRKKFSEQSKTQETLDMDFAASKKECEGLKQENEQLKSTLEDMKQKSLDSSSSQSIIIQKQLEDEIQFYKESNAKLGIQLEKTQESNVELVSILQELEEKIEKQKEEITAKLDEIELYKTMCENSKGSEHDSPENSELQSEQLLESQEKLLNTIHDLERTLNDRNTEIEKERCLKTQSLLDCERKWRSKLIAKEEEIINLEEKLSEAKLTRHSSDKKLEDEDGCYETKEIQALKEKVHDLERDCNELTDENLELLIKLKRAESNLRTNESISNPISICEDAPSVCQVTEVSRRSQVDKENEGENGDIYAEEDETQSESKCIDLGDKISELELQLLAYKDRISYLEDELLKCHAKAEEQEAELSSARQQLEYLPRIETNEKNNHRDNGSGDGLTENTPHYSDRGLTTTSVDFNDVFTLVDESLSPLQAKDDLKDDGGNKAPGTSQLLNSLLPCDSAVTEDKRVLADVADRQVRETATNSESLGSLDCKSLYGSVDSLDSVSEVFQRMSSELESTTHDLELNVSELEEENVRLSERVSGLEAQLRYLTDEKESSRLELQQSSSRVTFLQDEIRKLQTEVDAEKNDMHQKFLDMQQRWLEAQEECEYLKIVNPKLQATTEIVIEECSFLQRTNGDLRRQNIELHDNCALLQLGLRESENKYSHCITKFEALEEDFSSLTEEISLKEESFGSEIEALLHENAKLKEKIDMRERVLLQEYTDKKTEVESLQREVKFLCEQLSVTRDGSQTGPEAVVETSKLYGSNHKLETALQEVQKKLKWFENRYDTLQAKETELSVRLADSYQKFEKLMIEHEKLQGLLGEATSSEQIMKSRAYEFELKVKAFEYERLHLMEDIEGLKVQLLKLPELQNEVSALKSSLHEAKFANGRLEASFQLVYQDHEELKAEKASLVQKILSMQMLESELEDCRNSKVVLQEKLLRLEGDLAAKEAECAEDVKLKHELGRMRRSNSQLQRKIKDFAVDKDDFLLTSLDEDNLKQKILRHVASDLGSRYGSRRPQYNSLEFSISEESELPEVTNGHQSESPATHSDSAVYGGSKEQEYRQQLEAELRDLHDRYFDMSLKYAEVETEREELQIKLKLVEEGRTWFSYKP